MTGGFTLCEYKEVKQGFPEFQETMENLRQKLILKALSEWDPLKFAGLTYDQVLSMDKTEIPSGMYPKEGEFGEGTIMPQLFRSGTNSVPAATMLTTWTQTFGATTAQTIMSGANTGQIYEDYKIGLVGLAFLDKAIRIAEIRMQISDRKLPRINVEEAMAYEKPALIFEEGYILDEETGFELYAYVLSQGIQTIKLIGLELNRVPNKLQVTNTGAAIL